MGESDHLVSDSFLNRRKGGRGEGALGRGLCSVVSLSGRGNRAITGVTQSSLKHKPKRAPVSKSCLPTSPGLFPVCSPPLTPGFCSSKCLLSKGQGKFLVMSISPVDFQRGWAVCSRVQAPWLGRHFDILEILSREWGFSQLRESGSFRLWWILPTLN